MYNKKLFSLFILASIIWTSFAQECEPVSKEMYYMAEDFEVLKAGNRDKYVEFFPEAYFEPKTEYDGDFFWLYWHDIAQNLELDIQKRTPEEMKQLNRTYGVGWNYEKDLTMTIRCFPYLMVMGDYDVNGNEMKISLWSLLATTDFYNSKIIKDKVPFEPSEYRKHSAKFIFDGDYLDFYIDDIFIHKFCRINEASLKEYENLMLENECDLSKVKWPRHADGTSDYDDKIIMTEPNMLIEDIQKTFPQPIEENVEPEAEEVVPEIIAKPITKKEVKTVVTETCLLWEPEGTILRGINPGSKLKITKIGKTAIIDNIESNWVKVKTMPGATGGIYNDPFKEGFVGWIFGGYLN